MHFEHSLMRRLVKLLRPTVCYLIAFWAEVLNIYHFFFSLNAMKSNSQRKESLETLSRHQTPTMRVQPPRGRPPRSAVPAAPAPSAAPRRHRSRGGARRLLRRSSRCLPTQTDSSDRPIRPCAPQSSCWCQGLLIFTWHFPAQQF